MSITVCINGCPAEQFEAYVAILKVLGPVPDESQRSFDIWTVMPEMRANNESVWLNPPESSSQEEWIESGGAVIHSSVLRGRIEDRLRDRDKEIIARNQVETPLDPFVLGAFLAHDFPLVDALMLARAFRGNGWPNELSDYPEPLAGPSSAAPFAKFPRNAGLYAVVPSSAWVGRLAELRVPVVQLRDKRRDKAQSISSIREAIEAVANRSTHLFINDDWKLAIEHGAYGMHLGQEDLATADLAAIQKAGVRLGISTHGIYEMLRAHACRPSYMALGAIYATATKAMPTHPQGLRRLRHYVRLMSPHYPLVAIGGIDLSRIAGVWATGVDCAAVLRAIVDAGDYCSAACELMEMTPQLSTAKGPA